ncbi:acylphosphatase isozyme Ch1 [Lenzites betulinus]|nr:acylphosphatase isozyme Ch1 [Lenzites betulinus]
MAYRTIDFRVKGKVQGVYFRVFTKDTAQELGLVGWVKNEPTGDVVGTAQGDEGALAKFKDALRQGPSLARVEGVEFTNEAPLERLQFEDFAKIRNKPPQY